jgi:hypothetical protein
VEIKIGHGDVWAEAKKEKQQNVTEKAEKAENRIMNYLIPLVL